MPVSRRANGVIGPSICRRRAQRSPLATPCLPMDLARPLPDQLTDLTAAFEERYLRAAMAKTRGHVGKCAEMSGLSRRSITDKLAQYKSTSPNSRTPTTGTTTNGRQTLPDAARYVHAARN